MTNKRIYLTFLVLLMLYLPSACTETIVDNKDGRTVEIREEAGKFQLYRNGSPYFVMGAGGYGYFKELKEAGGNSIRVWGTENAQEILDKAHELGLTVTLGLKLAYAKTEMDYGDKKAVIAQQEQLKNEVLKYKDHPALLMWGIGNEPTLFLHPYSVIEHNRTWDAVNSIAQMVHEVDPNHPTTTMIQDLPGKSIFYISNFCKNIDVVSVNIFRSLGNEKISNILKYYGWNGPFMISEYGALGYWAEEHQTDWYALNEKTSTQKAQFIRDFYVDQIQSEEGNCLGSYIFYWGQKHEYTSTWLSLFTESGYKTEMIDQVQYLWTNKWPHNKAPSLHFLGIENYGGAEDKYLKAEEYFTATVYTSDPEQQNLTLEWEILKDDIERHFDATYNQKKPEIIDCSILSPNKIKEGSTQIDNNTYTSFTVSLRAPASEGPYRLFIYVRDEFDKVATANHVFYVIN